MRKNRLLLPWGLLAGLLILFAAVEGLNIKPPSLRTKSRNAPTTPKATPLTTTSTTTTTTTEAPETTTELEHENETLSEGNTTKSLLSGNPQKDYVHDPNLPRELPKGYNLSEYPFFERVPDNVEYDCTGKLDGFYANIEFKCQIYHHCLSGLRYDFLCANYTAFDQRTFICQFVSEVDCANSAKWWFRNEPLYKGRTTSSTTTTTAKPTTSTKRPAGGGGRRQRPFRRRRPQYDYYDDEDYDEEYEDELEAPGKNGDRQRKRQRKPTQGTIAAADADLDEKPLKPIGAAAYRPRVLPKIRRPVPINERDKYDYKKRDGATAASAGGDTQPAENSDKHSAATVGGSDKESEKPKRPADNSSPASAAEKSRPQKVRRPVEDEYYDDEDYDIPVRTSSRKNHHDYYAPSGGDRDFTRRPAMSGAGRPLRRNRPGRRRPALLEYDDDYEDVRRPYDRRRPTKSRKRPYQRDDYYDDEEEYDRPSYRDAKRPQTSRDTYERPSPARESVYDRAAPSRDTVPRSPSRNTPTYERTVSSSADSAYKRPATPTRDAPYERPAASTRDRDSTYERPAAPSRDSSYERPVTPTRDSTYERKPPSRDARPVANNRDTGYERSPIPSREVTYDRATPPQPPPPAPRDADYDRDLPLEQPEYSRTSNKEQDRTTVIKKRIQTSPRESTYERPRQDRPASRGSTDYERTVPSRPRPSDPEDQPIPAARPAYISTTGRTNFYRKRGPEEPVTTSGLRGIPRPTPKVTEPPLLDDEEYYDDEEEELEEELPQRPTGSGRTQTGSYRDTPVESRKPTGSEVEEPRSGTTRVKEEGSLDERERTRVPTKDRERVAQIPPTGRGRLNIGVDDVKPRIRQSYTDEENYETSSDGRVSGGKTHISHEQTRSNTNRATESILEQPPLRSTQGSQRTKEESQEDSVHQQRQGFRPVDVTTDRYSNFRRKPASGGATETKRAPPSREDRVVEIAEDVHIAPSSQGRSQTTGEAPEENRSQLDVELEGETSREDSSKQLDTSKFSSLSESEKEPVPLSSPSGSGFNNRSPTKSEEDEPIPTGRGASKTPELLDDTPHRNELPDINDPEYDVTLNEALQPTRPILLSTEGAVGKKKPSVGYPYSDVSLQPDKIQQTLLTSASQTHVSKAPLPHRPTPQYNDYDDPPIPTGKGGTTPVYSTTESVFRGSSIALASRGASGQQFPGNTRYVQFPTSPATGTLRHLEQELSKTLPRSRVNPLPYRSPAQGTIREADFYRGTIDPIPLSLGYDYDQAVKYRPRRKLVWRDRFHDFYNLY